MPLTGDKKTDFREFGKGRTYAHTKKKFGKEKADEQRIAVVLNEQRKKGRKKPNRTSKRSGHR
jgi:hypothetical protein